MATEDVKARKLRPIYDAIDNRNYKQANKLCQKKDVSNWLIAKALRAHALERMGKTEEALDLAREVKATNPTDEALLTTLALTFKLTGRLDELTELYEKAFEQDPSHESRAKEVFLCYARSCEFKKQQQLAQRLYKASNNTQYVYWAATSMIQQYESHQASAGPTVLQLAERMLSKVLNEVEPDRQPSAEELQLYVRLLRLQGKTQEALAALDLARNRVFNLDEIRDETSAENGTVVKITASALLALESQLLIELENWTRAVALLKDMLRTEPDNWENHFQLIRCSFAMVGGESNREGIQAQTIELQQFVHELQQANNKLRGPYLAEMHLLCEWSKVAHTTEVPTGWQSAANSPDCGVDVNSTQVSHQLMLLLVAFVEKFHQRICSFEDVKPYLAHLISNAPSAVPVLAGYYAPQAHTLAEQIISRSLPEHSQSAEGEVNSEYDAVATLQRNDLYKYCRLKQILCYLGALQRPRDTIKIELNEMFSIYQHTLPLNDAATGGKREVQAGDELIILMIALYKVAYADHVAELESEIGVDKVPENERLKLLFEAACVLQYGRNNSPFNFTFTMLMMELCRELGCVEKSVQLYNSLEIKHIQMDSLSYLLLPTALEGGLFREARFQHRQITKFHQHAPCDTGDWLAKSFRYGNYDKALEIADFLNVKLRHSLQSASSKATLPLLEVLQVCQELQEFSTYVQSYVGGMLPESSSRPTQEDCDKFSNNMDYGVIVPLEYVSEETDKQRAQLRRAHFESEIRANTTLMAALLNIFQSNSSAADTATNELIAILNENRDLQPDTLTEVAIQRSDTTGSGFDLSSTMIRTGGTKYTDLLYVVQVTLLRFCAAVSSVVQSPQQDASIVDIQKDLLCTSISHLRAVLLVPHAGRAPNRVCNDRGDRSAPLSPVWIRRISALLRIVSGLVGPLLQSCHQLLPASKKSKKNKKNKDKAAAPDASEQPKEQAAEAVNAVIGAFLEFFRDLSEATRHDDSDAQLAARDVLSFMMPSDAEAMVGAVSHPAIQEAAKEVADGVQSSNTVVVLRLREVLHDKITILSKIVH